MRKWLFVASLVLAGLLPALAAPVSARPITPNMPPNKPGKGADPLHAFCYAPTPTCTDNGTNTPTDSGQPYFGFWASDGPFTSQYLIDILVPNSEDPNPAAVAFNITGTQGGLTNKDSISAVASLFSATAWTGASGQDLDSYLGFSASPCESDRGLSPGNTGARSRRHGLLRLPGQSEHYAGSGRGQQSKRTVVACHEFGRQLQSEPAACRLCRRVLADGSAEPAAGDRHGQQWRLVHQARAGTGEPCVARRRSSRLCDRAPTPIRLTRRDRGLNYPFRLHG